MDKSKHDTVFKAFGKEFNREQAEWLIFSDKRHDIVYARNTDTLEEILQYGWQGTSDWTDQELQEALDELDEHNIDFHGADKEFIDMPGRKVA